jgi:hypothetical protein
MLACELDCGNDVGDISTSSDESGSSVDQTIVQLSRGFILLVSRLDQFTAQILRKCLDTLIVWHGILLFAHSFLDPKPGSGAALQIQNRVRPRKNRPEWVWTAIRWGC